MVRDLGTLTPTASNSKARGRGTPRTPGSLPATVTGPAAWERRGCV